MVERRYEWDEAKREANRAKHGVDFSDAERLDWDTSISGPDLRFAYGEARFLVYGLIDERLHVLVFAHRGDADRIISLRKANRREQAAYAAARRTQVE